ncbi:molybdopterin-dependent oxidoreductase [Desulfotignum phosphitoxidans]|uniref:Dimethyl sulfoxide reductase subunit/selenate reductase DmsA n=1 Tax=Desulfotignum phosphitoxidans DSM 13687 TaxID=1286635 RepID=S0FQB7_9BACT|nr:molybdopterin-dependent oxidoreductase [Desulfotignum phosphitoxidans]EMS77258.1 dimethyl sulfoxide reductase subunit/selenate reductase DmsA [Desulfotignum phosphitoxidans DSM 13687]
MGVNRREFIKTSLAAGALTSLDLKFMRFAGSAAASAGSKGETVTRTTCSPNCTGACGFNVHVKDGRITTLIQAADYPEDSYNPRGCLRGLSMMNLVYGKDRIKYPLIRTGPRGSGEFRRASWDEALDYTADKLKKITKKYGPEAIATTIQVPGTGYVHKGAFVRLAGLAQWTIHHGYDQNGDLPMFWPMTFGVQTEELESLEWPNAGYTIVLGSNLVQTRLPDVHHLIEAKKTGKVVVVDPDFCSTASKADEWVSIKLDTDAALALGLARVIIDRGLYDKAFLQDFTDMPVLVRKDTGKRLPAEQVKALKAQADQMKIPEYRDLFVVSRENRLTILDPGHLGSTHADLTGSYKVELTDGTTVEAVTVFSLLREMLAEYSLETVAQITGAPAQTIERIAVEAATRTPLHIVYGASNYQWYHGDLKGRALSLLPVLTGSIGVSGGGISTYAGQYRIRFDVSEWWFPKEGKLNWVPYLHFLNSGGPRYPEKGIKAMIGGWGNPFDQHNMSNALKDRSASGDIEFVATFDFNMTTTCMWSDVVFPATTWYENYELTATILHPYLQLQEPAIAPLFEARTGLALMRGLAKRLNPDWEAYFYPDIDDTKASLEIIDLLLKTGGMETRGITLDMVKKGPVRLHSTAPDDRQVPFYEQIHDRVPFPPPSYPAPLPATARFVKSGRIEFYKDEDLFLAEGEQLPVCKPTFEDTEYKEDPDALTKYRLRFVTKNSLYRVHSTHSNNVWLNELQGHKPKMFLNPADAAERNIAAHDLVEVYNNRGKTRAWAVIDPGCRRGTLIFEQGWWAKYLQDQSYNSLTRAWIKPLHEIYFVPGIWSPTTVWNECLVDARRITT